jgi:hypothetical protein
MSTVDAGNVGEEAVREELRKIKGSLISGFIRTKNINYYDKNFQIDFLLFAPKIGLVVLEVKNWKGKIKATSSEKWTQEYSGYKNEFGNASLQSLRTSGLLLQILEKGKINKYPIRPVVVFANSNATILKSTKQQPQTDIILKDGIDLWLKNNAMEEIFYKFTKDDFEQVKRTICEYTTEYIED